MEKKDLEDSVEDLDTQVKVFDARIDVLMTGFAFRLKEHPRAESNMRELGKILKADIADFIYNGNIPLSKAPSLEDARNSISIKLEPKVQATEVKKAEIPVDNDNKSEAPKRERVIS
jgi:hypothetical protein